MALPEGWKCPISGAPKAEFIAEGDATTKPRSQDKPQDGRDKNRPVERPTSAAEVVAAVPRPLPTNAWTVGSLKKKTAS